MLEWQALGGKSFLAFLEQKHRQPRSVQPQARLLAYLHDVGGFGDCPEWIGARMFDVGHRLMLAQVSPLRVRVSVFLVVVPADDVGQLQPRAGSFYGFVCLCLHGPLHWLALISALYFSRSEIACRGQSRIANFTFSISAVGGFSISRCAWSSRTSKTSGAAAAHRSFPSQSFRSTTIFIAHVTLGSKRSLMADAHPQAILSQSVPSPSAGRAGLAGCLYLFYRRFSNA